jgi:hypothetical protein
MTITVELPPEVESRIKTQALKGGIDVSDYLVSLIDDASEVRERIEKASDGSFDQILAPIRAGFSETGESDEEIMEFFEEVRDEVWLERRGS